MISVLKNEKKIYTRARNEFYMKICTQFSSEIIKNTSRIYFIYFI